MLRLMDQANHSRQQLFISHAVEDNSMALRLKKDLEYHGFQIWLDLDEIAPGVQWDNAIRSAIRESLAILYLASPNSRSSPNVFHEIGMAKIYRCSILPLWIGGTKWADVANFGFYSVQYIDLRSDRYTDGLDRLVQLLRQLQVTHPLDESI
jgi:hypothetical protein